MKLFTLVIYKPPGHVLDVTDTQHDCITLTTTHLGQDDTFRSIAELYRDQLNIPTLIRDKNYSVTQSKGAAVWRILWNRSGHSLLHLWVICADSAQNLHEVVQRYRLAGYTDSPPIKFGQYWRDVTDLIGEEI